MDSKNQEKNLVKKTNKFSKQVHVGAKDTEKIHKQTMKLNKELKSTATIPKMQSENVLQKLLHQSKTNIVKRDLKPHELIDSSK